MDLVQMIGSYLASDIRMATPILLAGLGLLLINRAGLLNIGAEGTILIATLIAVVGSFFLGNVWLGLLCAMIAGALIGGLFALLTVTLRANQTVVGAAINVLGSGLSATLYRIIFGVATNNAPIDTFDVLAIPLVKDIPILGEAFFQQKPIVYIAFLMVPLVSYYLFRTQSGLNLRSVGENPKVADTLGINVARTQYSAAIVGSAIIAMGGRVPVHGFAEFLLRGNGVRARLYRPGCGDLRPV